MKLINMKRQVPFRGMGANTAIIDACDLGRRLGKAAQEGSDLNETLKKYEEVMIPRGRDKVLQSRATGDSDVSSEIAGGRAID